MWMHKEKAMWRRKNLSKRQLKSFLKSSLKN